MKARAMNSKAAVAAAMMMLTVAVLAPRAAHASNLVSVSHKVATRTVLKYGQGAWTGAAAVVLKSQQEWDGWNAMMTATGKAVGPEQMPAGVDWTKDALLVVSWGQDLNADYSVDVASAMRTGAATQVTLSVTAAADGGNDPCVVVAMDRNMANAVDLLNAPAGVATRVQEYAAAPTQAAGSDNVAASWGAVKAAYRQ